MVQLTISQETSINTLYIYHLSHITTLYLIALLHYSHPHSTSLAADPHGLCNVTLVPPWWFCARGLQFPYLFGQEP